MNASKRPRADRISRPKERRRAERRARPENNVERALQRASINKLSAGSQLADGAEKAARARLIS